MPLLTFLRHLQYHIARITPSAGVYGRAGVSVSTTFSLDVHWVTFFAKHQQYEPKYLYYHFVLSFMSCYYNLMLSFILCYTFLLSFDFIIIIGVIVFFLFEPINKDLWYFYPNIDTKLSKIWVAFLGIRIWDLRSGFRKTWGL
jgi:hypothetical protein